MHSAMTSLGAVLLIFLTASCASHSAAGEGLGVSTVQFQDVPVPAGLKLRTGGATSHSFAAGDWRFGNFEYVGLTPADEAVRYMQDRMGYHGWKMSESERGKTSSLLRFDRRPYSMKCRIWREDGLTHMSVAVRTEVVAMGPSDADAETGEIPATGAEAGADARQ